MSGIIAPQYHDEDAAREHLEGILWPDGPVCPHCGLVGEAYKLNGVTTRKGLYKCAGCREPFTVTVGTIFEDSHIPLHKWLLAVHLMCSSKKGISAHQLWRNLWGVDKDGKQSGSYRTAWFMAHRIRWALTQEPLASKLAGIVEVDETYVGGKAHVGEYLPSHSGPGRKSRKARPSVVANKAPVVSLLQREGDVRSFHIANVTGVRLKSVMKEMIAASAHVMTDESTMYRRADRYFPRHSSVNHSRKEYSRREGGLTITTNTVEGYFSILKRGVYGTFHHVSRAHLFRYLSEFDFRYNARKLPDQERTILVLKGARGKRLMLKQPKGS
ncbi:MAG: IS1595 family transposase [Bryobacteraceae bacterium]|jgi:transposase-like protein